MTFSCPSITVSLYCTWGAWDCQNGDVWFGKKNLSTKFSTSTHRTSKAGLCFKAVGSHWRRGWSEHTWCSSDTTMWLWKHRRGSVMPLPTGNSSRLQRCWGCRTVPHKWGCWRSNTRTTAGARSVDCTWFIMYLCFPAEGKLITSSLAA